LTRKMSPGIMLTLLIASMLTLAFNQNTVQASPETILYIDPPSIVDQTLTPGSTFTVNVMVSDVEFLFYWQANVTFNPDVLRIVDVVEGDFLKASPEGTFGAKRIEASWALFGWTIIGSHLGISGSGILATVEFEVLAMGESLIEFAQKGYLTYLDAQIFPLPPPWFVDIPFTAVNGYFNNLVAVVSSTLDIRPDTLNLVSKGRWITAYIELPDGYDVGDIDCTSIRLGKEVIHSGNLVTNGGFEDGLYGWTTSGGGTGYYSHVVVDDGTEHPDTLEYTRWASGADGGSAGAGQDLDILVSDYDSLYLELDVEVISNALQSSGWWSYQRGGYGEFPVAVFIRYEDSDGNIWNWNYNFFPSDNNEYYGRTNFSYVDRNVWYHYVSPNLADVTTTLTGPYNQPIPSPTPYRITGISVGGTGWDFNGRVDNVNLWGTKISDGIAPASHGKSVESAIGDYDGDSIPDLMVKFDRAEIESYVLDHVDMGELVRSRFAEVTLAVTGEFTEGTPFQGSDIIKIICTVP
jgi:hypothetical protein